MSVSDLYEELWSMEYRITGDKPRAKSFARDFLDRHAHELAKQIRSVFGDDWNYTTQDAADMIDPKMNE